MALTGLLSLPAFLGILSWIVAWLIPHKGSLTLIIEEIFVVMVWIGQNPFQDHRIHSWLLFWMVSRNRLKAFWHCFWVLPIQCNLKQYIV